MTKYILGKRLFRLQPTEKPKISLVKITSKKSILITIPLSLASDLDRAASALHWTRSDVIRRCLSRDIQYLLHYEIPALSSAHEPVLADHKDWVSNTFRLMKRF